LGSHEEECASKPWVAQRIKPVHIPTVAPERSIRKIFVYRICAFRRPKGGRT
jgi:hypothetical protein